MIITPAPSSKFISICNILNLIHLMLINLVNQRINLVGGTFVDHCYSDIGCFPLSDEFYHPRHRPFNVRPWHRRRIKIRFHLYSRKHLDGFELRPWNRLNLLESGFNPMLDTKIIIPGWLDNIKRALWVRRMKDSFLWLWQPVNIIVVHWKNFTPYTIATANTRVVGAELANLLKSIEHELHYDRSYYHLVGHSLGAHIGGYCGDRMPGLGRITALDPARPFFQHMPKSVRLDRGDARFVDAIHSDFTPENAIFLLMSFGMTTPVGHLDFYPNGPPLLQPGCLRDTILSVRNGIQRGLEHSSLSVAFLEALRYLTACDHQRSHEWFIESITNRQCVFVGVRCNQFEGLINGRCTCDNSRSACAIMGIHADQMYLNKAHQDLWPLGHDKASQSSTGRYRRRPSSAPSLGLNQLELANKNNNKNHIYSRLKHQAEELRKPPVPTIQQAATGEIGDDEADNFIESVDDFEDNNIEDSAFVDYLRTNIILKNQFHPLKRPILSAPSGGLQESSNILYNHHNQLPNEISSSSSYENTEAIQKRQDGNVDDDLGLGHLFNNNNNNGVPPFNDHPKLLSDIDRDIESWYEESSRWYLKTNHRPSYCVNQYQVLVFLGPLKTNTGHHHIRANLIISIIGSRGQLMNQRFVPRSANLDSFTMQPFFIILEGSYSLGNIVSVAIGWEARIDPEPIQATISFQSNLMENVQSMLPTYKARHPWLSETIKYDHSGGFKWHGGNVYGLPPQQQAGSLSLKRRSIVRSPLLLEKRSGNIDNNNNNNRIVANDYVEGCGGGHSASSLNLVGGQCNQKRKQLGRGSSTAEILNEFLAGKSSLADIDDYLDQEASVSAAAAAAAASDEDDDDDEDDEGSQPSNGKVSAIISGGGLPVNENGNHIMQAVAGSQPEAKFIEFPSSYNNIDIDRNIITKSSQNNINNNKMPLQMLHHHQQHKQTIQQDSIHQHHNHHLYQHHPKQRLDPAEQLLQDIYIDSQREITAKLNNIGIHLDHDNENSIVVSQVVVSPLQATYGKGGHKIAKIFCPPHQNYRLQRERTVRLRPNLLGKCQNDHQHSIII